MITGGILPRPILKFKYGTALTPIEGLKLNLKPFSGPSKIKIELLIGNEAKSNAEELFENLTYGVKGYPGISEVFNCEVDVLNKIIVNENNFLKSINDISSSSDIILAFIPDEMQLPYNLDPYMPIKRELSMRGIVSQMVNYSTCKYLKNNSYVLYNLALNIYSKAGGKPWTLNETLSSQIFIGYDTAPGIIVATIIQGKPPMKFKWEIELTRHPEIASNVDELIIKLVNEFNLNEPINSLTVHKDGRIHQKEIIKIRSAIKELIKRNLMKSNANWNIIEVKKKFTPRILRVIKNLMENPEKGTYIKLNKYSTVICTTGYPERKILFQAPVRPIMIEVVDSKYWNYNLDIISRDIYWLSELHYASAFTSTKLPITILYAHRICSFWNADVKPKSNLKEKLWFL